MLEPAELVLNFRRRLQMSTHYSRTAWALRDSNPAFGLGAKCTSHSAVTMPMMADNISE